MGIADIAKGALGAAEAGTQTIDQVAKGNLGAITQSTGWVRFMWWARISIWVLVICIALICIWHYYLRYNKRILIKKLKGNAVIDCYIDRGRITTDARRNTKISLLRTRKTSLIPSYKYTSKMGKQDFYEYYLDEKGNLYPISDEPLMGQVTDSIRSDKRINFQILAAWRLEEMKLAEAKFKKQTFLEKYRAEIMVFMAMVFCTAMVWITMKSIETAGVEHAMAIKELAQALASLK